MATPADLATVSLGDNNAINGDMAVTTGETATVSGVSTLELIMRC